MQRFKPVMMALLAGVLSAGAAAQECSDADKGEKYVDCQAKTGDNLAIYLQGRDAYDAGRDNGDFSKALTIARELDKKKDKNGERLLKMVHLQLSWGGHKDLPQAYGWLNEDLNAGKDYVAPLINQLAKKMTPEQLKQAKAAAGQ